MTVIKVCRVEDIHTARLCGDLGVNMLGFHGIHGLTFTKMRSFSRITSELRSFYPKVLPVLVTKVTDPVELAHMLSATGVDWVQVHVPLDSQLAQALLQGVATALGREPGYVAVVAADDPSAISRARDLGGLAGYILVDASYRGGTGHRADNHTVREILRGAQSAKVLVAGGLTVENVARVLIDLAPDGVDVQTGLEIQRLEHHDKDPVRLFQFVNKVREVSDHPMLDRLRVSRHRPLVSLAITSVPERQIDDVLERFRQTDIDLVHLDFSDRSVAPHFFARPFSALSRLAELVPCLPYDVHLFVRDPAEQDSILRECLERNPLLRVVLMHYSRYERSAVRLFHSFALLVEELGVGMGVAIQATGFSSAQLDPTLRVLDAYVLEEVSLITRSRSHSLEEVAKYDLPLLERLTSWSREKDGPLFVSVDRDINLRKLAVLSRGRPNHVVVGAMLLASEHPQRSISKLRRLVKPPIETSKGQVRHCA